MIKLRSLAYRGGAAPIGCCGEEKLMRYVTLPHGEDVPALGLGTWRMGESGRAYDGEVAALRLAFDEGWRLVDTAEMYGDGGAERVVGDALAQALRAGTLVRDDVFVVSKVLPQHADARGVRQACERSLRRLRLDRIDLYLLHWRGAHPLAETVDAFEELQQRGWIRHWGVSNFDLDDMLELTEVPGGAACSANQVYYSLSERGVEFDLLPWQRVRQMPAMAYCPLDRGALAQHPALAALAQRLGVAPAQLALAWVLAQPGVIAIPKAVRAEHLRADRAAAELPLDAAALAALDRLFPPPRRKRPLAMT
jgi:diketogulonate reductase-like aldo/keto reductase